MSSNEKQVIFRCTTCEYRNSMDLGMPHFIPFNTEFESLSDAYNHMINNENHEVIAVIKEE